MSNETVIIGMGEIGSALYKLLKPTSKVYGYDLTKAKCRGKQPLKASILHICIPYSNIFLSMIICYILKYAPKEVIIHSSVPPGITEKLECSKNIVVYSPVRGVHKRMRLDMQRYTKYWASKKKPKLFIAQMKKCKIPVKPWNDSMRSLELAKLWMDVTYYGWLIIFAQHTKVLADRYNVKEKRLWEFTKEIHRYLGNRPCMYSGEGIGGHCILQDVELLNDLFLTAVFSHNKYYTERYTSKLLNIEKDNKQPCIK